MSLAEIARRILPADSVASLSRDKKRLRAARIARLAKLSEADFARILVDDLGLRSRDTVYVHSSVDQLSLGFPFPRILALIRQAIGPDGTMLFPTYSNHRISSYEYLLQGKVFDVRRTPSYTGILTEFARRQRGARRSLHPTKSVCAIGAAANELTATHQQSPYPYDTGSPYYKLIEHDAKIVGLGVTTNYLSFVYCVDDALKERFPVRVYHDRIFDARCIDYDGETVIVRTYAHDMSRVIHTDMPRFMKRYVSDEACRDLRIRGMNFFRARASQLFAEMMNLAERGITTYPRSVYGK